MTEIGLVSCTKQKRTEPSRPADLYTPSAYFRKMKAYCETHHDQWYILSAKHGLLEPDGDPIESYDRTLRNATRDEQRRWAKEVFERLQVQNLLEKETLLVIHAGKDYYEELLPLFEETDVAVEIPTQGLKFGETLKWYNEHL